MTLMALLGVPMVLAQQFGDVRMLGDPNNTCHGRVQLYDGTAWGSIPVGPCSWSESPFACHAAHPHHVLHRRWHNEH